MAALARATAAVGQLTGKPCRVYLKVPCLYTKSPRYRNAGPEVRCYAHEIRARLKSVEMSLVGQHRPFAERRPNGRFLIRKRSLRMAPMNGR